MNNSSDFMVTTISGKQVPRKKCRFIKNQYYEINVDCFFMSDNSWHRVNNGKIAFDHEQKKYVLIDEISLREGIIGVQEDGSFAMGMFSANPVKNTEINNIPCISYEIAESMNLLENISTGTFYSPDKVKNPADLKKKRISNRYSFQLDYSAAPRIGMFTEAYNSIYYPKNVNNLKLKYPNALGETTFGFEIETHDGSIPERHLIANGLIPLRDGSLRHGDVEPYEYSTIPLSKEKGLLTMIDIADLVNKYTTIGNKCALHVHIGGYTPSKEFVVAFHRVIRKVQDEIYSMFPDNYKFTSENGFKQKNYCAPVKDLRILKKNSVEDNFNVIYGFYSGGAQESFRGFGEANHPKDRDNRRKWEVESRYYIANIVPLIWGGSGTIEWRIHPPTQNIHKILNWLYICNAVIKYAHVNAKEIADFSSLADLDLLKIMYSIYPDGLAKILCSYIDWRKDYMKDMDRTGDKELQEDLVKPITYSVLS